MGRPDPSIVRIGGPWRHLDVHANGIRFHVVEAERRASGADDQSKLTDRPLVILLHGFGSFWWSWRHQLKGLTGARVVAVDLRGYGGSDKPPRGYDGWTLAGDTAGLVRALGHTSATLVGHADGGLVCWATSVLHPRSVHAIAVVSSPHPAALRTSAMIRRDQGRALLPLRGDADPYVLADPVYRTQRYAPHGRYVSIEGAGHFGHEEAPETVNEQLSRFLAQVYP